MPFGGVTDRIVQIFYLSGKGFRAFGRYTGAPWQYPLPQGSQACLMTGGTRQGNPIRQTPPECLNYAPIAPVAQLDSATPS